MPIVKTKTLSAISALVNRLQVVNGSCHTQSGGRVCSSIGDCDEIY